VVRSGKRHRINDMWILYFFFETRRSKVQILSPRPLLLKSITCFFRIPLKMRMSAWYRTICSLSRLPSASDRFSFRLMVLEGTSDFIASVFDLRLGTA
jgi:hypothetical protein